MHIVYPDGEVCISILVCTSVASPERLQQHILINSDFLVTHTSSCFMAAPPGRGQMGIRKSKRALVAGAHRRDHPHQRYLDVINPER